MGNCCIDSFERPFPGMFLGKSRARNREKQLAPSNVVSIAMVYDSAEYQNKTYTNYVYVDHIYVCSVVSLCQGPAATIMQTKLSVEA